MGGRKFELTKDTLSIIEEIGGHMPGGLCHGQAGRKEYSHHCIDGQRF